MRKGFLIVLAVALAAAMAVPATAGTDINGFYRAKAYMSNFKGYLGAGYTGASVPAKDEPTNSYVDQRFRIKFTSGEENVKATFFVETDTVWGHTAFSSTTGYRNTGGGLGTDAASLELKNAYLWFKVPGTSLDFTVGLQGQSDSYAGVFMAGTDMAGIFVNGKFDPVAVRLGWAKWTEADLHESDDRTLYLAEVKFAPAKEMKLGVNFYALQDDTNKAAGSIQRVYMPGVDFTFGAGPATINAFAFYQFGKYTDYTSATPDIDINGFAADARVDLNAGPGKAFVEGLYISGGNDPGTKYKSIVDAGYTNSFYTRTDMQILLLNADDIGTVGSLVSSMGNGGRGLMHFAGGFNMKLMDKLSGKIGAGYLAAVKKKNTDPAEMKKGMGTEVNASVNYNLAKGLDVGVVGAYAWIGDFFKTPTFDPDNAFDLHARVNYAF